METHGERLETFINLKFKTKREFCKLIGFNENSLNKYAGAGSKSIFGKEYQAKLSELGLNLAWYLTGEGEMLTKKAEVNSRTENISEVEKIDWIGLPDLTKMNKEQVELFLEHLEKLNQLKQKAEKLKKVYEEIE